MSGRALRRLREEREASKALECVVDEDEDGESSADDEQRPKSMSAFALMGSSSQEEDDDEEEEEQSRGEIHEKEETVAAREEETQKEWSEAASKPTISSKSTAFENKEPDLDELLAEFESIDQELQNELDQKPAAVDSWFSVVVDELEVRDLDIDFVMRNNLLSGGEGDTNRGGSSRSRQAFVFGTPRSDWHKPPHFVGGGIGMTTYHDADGDSDLEVPWPYMSTTDGLPEHCRETKLWYTFLHSDTYQKDLEDYRRIQETGDANALALFVAHHPFVPDAQFQLATLLYLTNQSQEGLLLLRRSLWIHECASLSSFTPWKKQDMFMDYDRMGNQTFFHLLFRLMRVSSIAGCLRTSLAVARLILSLDPLRDPLAVLVIMDYFALANRVAAHDGFLIKLVESKRILLYHHNEGKEFVGSLTDLPNWAYSYALALHRRAQEGGQEAMSDRANKAMFTAVRRFPGIVEELLIKNEVDVHGRSTRVDWPSVLPALRSLCRASSSNQNGYDPILQHAARSAADMISKIFVERQHKLWSEPPILSWLYKQCELVAEEVKREHPMSKELSHPSIIRYSKVDPDDFKDRHRTLPPEANPLDPALLAPAMEVDPNRRRLFRGRVGRGGAGLDRAEEQMRHLEAMANRPAEGFVVGGPPTGLIDPDSPMMEVFLRSFLPWNEVEGVERARPEQPPP